MAKILPGMKMFGSKLDPNAWFRATEEMAILPVGWEDAQPDMRDPATIGCLLHQVQEKYSDPSLLWGGRVEIHQEHSRLFCLLQPYHTSTGELDYRCLHSGETFEALLKSALS